MARAAGRLTALKVERLRGKPGLHPDGGGLYLQVKNGGASWVLRFRLDGRSRYLGLGPVALDARRLRHGGTDPIEAKRAERLRRHLEAAKAITFEAASQAYVTAHKAGWRNAKHAGQWASTLATYAGLVLGDLPVTAIDTAAVMRVFEQQVDGLAFWQARPETASRVRQRGEAVLGWARVRGYRQGREPDALERPSRPAPAGPREAPPGGASCGPPYAAIGSFMAALKQQNGVAARALEFCILTAARTGEVIGATWSEIDFEAKLWTIPGERMKAGRAHRVPLSQHAVGILTALRQGAGAAEAVTFVFPGGNRGKPLSNIAMEMVLRRMGRHDITVHGFRSSLRDWAGERTRFPCEVRRWRSHTPSATRSRPPIFAAISLISGGT